MISAGMLLCDLSNLQGCHTANAEDQCIRLAAPVEGNSTSYVSWIWAPYIYELEDFYMFVMNQTYRLCVRSLHVSRSPRAPLYQVILPYTIKRGKGIRLT